ncbi:unnamed protein product, partial [Musa textilis]
EDTVRRLRESGGGGAVLRRRSRPVLELRREGARRQQGRGEAPPSSAAPEELLLPFPDPPSTSADIPACDVCKDKAGYFFCLEDRALLCRQCDATTHAAKPRGSSHQRFLITGVRSTMPSTAAAAAAAKPTAAESKVLRALWRRRRRRLWLRGSREIRWAMMGGLGVSSWMVSSWTAGTGYQTLAQPR